MAGPPVGAPRERNKVRTRVRVFLGWLLLALAFTAHAQLTGRTGSAPAAAASAPAARDPLDRGTPRRAIAAFARAAQRGDLVLAARYAQSTGRTPARAEALASELGQLLDRHFRQPLSSISDAPEGDIADGLSPERERIGPLRVGDQEQFIELVRVSDATAGQVWLISAETLARVASLAGEEGSTWPERVLPAGLFERILFNFTWADFLLWIASLLLPLLLLPQLLRLGLVVAQRVVPSRAGALEAWYDATRWPIVVLLALGVHAAALSWYGPTLSFRIAYSRLLAVVLVVVLAWGMKRAGSVFFRRTGTHLHDRGRTGAQSVLLLGERLLNVLIFLVALLLVLSVAGFDMKAVLAGLGIVGVALALGAQKTIENILGGMMLLGDEAIAVGDLCRINNRLGIVEDITLRSVRFRTIEHTLLSIPAGVLAQAELENFATRNKMLAQHRLRLAFDTSAQQLRRIRERVAQLVDDHPRLEHPLSRIRLVEFGPAGIELEVYAYVLTHDPPEFLAIREDLLLQVLTIVEEEDARFAPPAAIAGPPLPPDPTR